MPEGYFAIGLQRVGSMKVFETLKKCMAVFALLAIPASATYVAVLETMAPKDVLSLEEKQYLTDVLRSEAVKALPAEMNFTIMTRDNIQMMLPPGKGIEECEGSCLVETGKNIAADYIAQGRVGRFGSNLTITVEMYETAGNKLMGSFTAKSSDIEKLEVEIRKQAKSLFMKARGNAYAQPAFASGISAGPQMVALKIQSVPMGASIAIDGRPTKCMSTPCTVNIPEGEHRVLAARDDYQDKDSLLMVEGAEMALMMNLEPNFGQLNVDPKYDEYLGNGNPIVVTIDGKTSRNDVAFKKGINNLPAGPHSVQISHPCYETASFNVGITVAKTEKFDQELKRGKGWLTLKAVKDGSEQKVPVWVDGAKVGETPFVGEVPLCSKIEAGDGEFRGVVAAELKVNANVEVTHELVKSGQPVVAEEKAEPEKEQQPAQANVEEKQAQASEAAADVANKEKGMSIAKPIGIGLAVLGAAAFGIGIYENSVMNDERGKYDDATFTSESEADDQWDKVKKASTLRNVFYGVGAGLLAAGITVFFVF